MLAMAASLCMKDRAEAQRHPDMDPVALSKRYHKELPDPATGIKSALDSVVTSYFVYNGQEHKSTGFLNGKEHGWSTVKNDEGKNFRDELYDEGQLIATYRYDPRDGTLRVIELYDDQGKIKELYEVNDDCEVTAFTPYRDGNIHGTAWTKHPNGNLQRYTNYKHGKSQGYSPHFDSRGYLLHENNYVDGKLHGLQKIYYKGSDNVLQEQSYFDMGVVKGVTTRCRKDSTKESDITFNDKEREGACIFYHTDGVTPSSVEYYQDGKREGVFTTHYETGVMQSYATYHNDKLEGVHITYYNTGIIKSCTNYHDNKREGAHVDFDEMGNVKAVTVIENGELQREESQRLANDIYNDFSQNKNVIINGVEIKCPLEQQKDLMQKQKNGIPISSPPPMRVK